MDNGGDEPGPAGAHRLGGILRGPWDSRAREEQLPDALVPGERSAGRPADDVDEHRALQRASWRLVAVGPVLKRPDTQLPVYQYSAHH